MTGEKESGAGGEDAIEVDRSTMRRNRNQERQVEKRLTQAPTLTSEEIFSKNTKKKLKET